MNKKHCWHILEYKKSDIYSYETLVCLCVCVFVNPPVCPSLALVFVKVLAMVLIFVWSCYLVWYVFGQNLGLFFSFVLVLVLVLVWYWFWCWVLSGLVLGCSLVLCVVFLALGNRLGFGLVLVLSSFFSCCVVFSC